MEILGPMIASKEEQEEQEETTKALIKNILDRYKDKLAEDVVRSLMLITFQLARINGISLFDLNKMMDKAMQDWESISDKN